MAGDMKQKRTAKKNKDKHIPYQYKPDGMDLKTWQQKLRKQAAKEAQFLIFSVDEENAPGEYRVNNPRKRETYKVVYRGARSPWNYCSCMDFKTSQLGTCKHLEAVKMWIGQDYPSHRHCTTAQKQGTHNIHPYHLPHFA